MKLKELVEQFGEYEVKSENLQFENGEDIHILLESPKPKTVGDLKKGDLYYCTDIDGEIIKDVWCGAYQDEREMGNAFLTKEEAEKDVERRKVEALLLQHGGRRWFNTNTWNYFLRDENHLGNDFWIDEIWASPVQGVIYFDTKEQIEKAVSEIGIERIRKALFEVR